MKIDLEHLHYWMQAIRISKDPKRTMDSFWRGQISSKEWLIEKMSEYVTKQSTIDIHGGWVGVLASMIFQSDIPVSKIRSIDIDLDCEEISSTMNKIEEMQGRFRAITADMCSVRSDADVIINTSCEHISQDEYDLWLSGHPANSLLILQSNNFEIPEHKRIAETLEEFESQCGLKTVLFKGKLELSLYTRWMIIGKNV